MMTRSKLVVGFVVGVIGISAVIGIILRSELRCAGFAGPGITQEDLPASLDDPGQVRIVAWNIRNFPIDERPEDANLGFSRRTNICDLQDVLGGLDADVMFLSEIRDTRRFAPLMRRAGGRRQYREVHSQRGGSLDQYLTLVWDSSRLEKVGGHIEIAELALEGGLRPGLAARFKSRSPGGIDFAVVGVHLAYGPGGYDSRLEQYEILTRWVSEYTRSVADDDIVVLGDFNTAGTRGFSSEEEILELDRIMATAGLRRHHNLTGCSEYWEGRGPQDGIQESGLLDLVYLGGFTEADQSEGVRAWLHCARLECGDLVSKVGAEDGTFWDVSDHCPITFEVEDLERDP